MIVLYVNKSKDNTFVLINRMMFYTKVLSPCYISVVSFTIIYRYISYLYKEKVLTYFNFYGESIKHKRLVVVFQFRKD